MTRTFLAAVVNPSPEPVDVVCSQCAARARVELPDYLTQREYLAFIGCITGVGLAMLLALDVTFALRVQLFVSCSALYVGLAMLLTWTQARVKVIARN